jgi:hypothetical protein
VKLADLAPDRASLERLEARFWSKVDVRGDDECWPWTACMGASGPSWKRATILRYGRFGIRRGLVLNAHRVACILTFGEMPDSLLACHHCDNTPCCNPAHLFAGTARENAEDRDRKGRYVHGERRRGAAHPSALLTEDQVREIRHRYGSVRTGYPEIGRRYGISKEVIGSILRGRTWKHV